MKAAPEVCGAGLVRVRAFHPNTRGFDSPQLHHFVSDARVAKLVNAAVFKTDS